MRALALAGSLALMGALAVPAHARGDTAGEAALGDAQAQPGTGTVDSDAPPPENAPAQSTVVLPAGTRSGLEIYRSFREGLSGPACSAEDSARWRRHFAHAPEKFTSPGSDVLPLFGYVVDRLREVHLPTEYALIPFVESGYRPGAKSPQGPAGLWQFIALTARNHKVPVGAGYDGRLSPVDSTEAAVRYLRTLHGMFAGDWRLAVMAYNAGEYRVLGALRSAGQRPATADPASLPMPQISRAYVRKLQALACLLTEAGDTGEWLQALDRPVPILTAATVPARIASLDALARAHGADPVQLRRLNPAHGNGRIARIGGNARVLLPSADATAIAAATTPRPALASDSDISDAMADASALVEAVPARTHVVARGDSAWAIARRYGLGVAELLERNGLDARGVLRPGMVLAIDPAGAGATVVAE
ncbi:transglycosylase SLT domain-containing protein [Luteimonas composti]|uniref:Transglycosylase SLT domain-containing protein n=2 Tax=Luteimonas composti TaxID=398257 RepID=A0ABT6MVZ9_9GAMM|nr:lytic transglycosylase domain-containing protein [Luteimonas composti]MDH7454644.1 transglycosylase SLT domain-containing protein [Luteimonas composti]